MEGPAGGRGRVTPPSLSRRFWYRSAWLQDPGRRARGAHPAGPIGPYEEDHTAKRHDARQQRQQPCAAAVQSAAIPTRRPVTTKAMKISPWAMPKTLTPISVRGLRQVLEIHPDQQTDPADGLGRARPDETTRPRYGDQRRLSWPPLCPNLGPITTKRRRALARPAGSARRPARLPRTAPRRRSRTRVGPAQGPHAARYARPTSRSDARSRSLRR